MLELNWFLYLQGQVTSCSTQAIHGTLRCLALPEPRAQKELSGLRTNYCSRRAGAVQQGTGAQGGPSVVPWCAWRTPPGDKRAGDGVTGAALTCAVAC